MKAEQKTEMGWRWARLLLLALCSPFLIPLLCLSCPLLSLAALCLRLSSKPRRPLRRPRPDRRGPGRLEVEEEAEGNILQQYLEDQLRLVRFVVYDDDDDDGEEDDDEDGFLSSSCA